MKTWVKVIKNISFWILVTVSFILNLNLFVSLVTDLYEKIVIGFVSLALEGSKIYFLVIANNFWNRFKVNIKPKEKKIFFRKAFIRYTLYFALALLAITASFGFILTSLDYKDQVVSVTSHIERIESLKEEIEDINQEIQILLEQQEELPADWITRRYEIADKIIELREDKHELREQIDQLQQTESEKSKDYVARDMFFLIGEILDQNKKTIQFVILIFLAFMIEISIFATSLDNESSFMEDKILDISVTNKSPIKENVLKFVYNKIYYYVKNELEKSKDNKNYKNVYFSMSDININLDDDIVRKYFTFLAEKGFIVKADKKTVYNDKHFYRLKVYKLFEQLFRRKVRK